ALHDDRTKGPNHVFVLPDAPKDTFYVVTLVKREVKTDADFKLEVTGPLGRQMGGAVVQRDFDNQVRRNAYLSVIGLLKQEFKFEVTDEQKKKLEKNEAVGGDT